MVFQKYDRNRDGHLTMEEYNQWQIDSGKVQRVFTTQIRFDRFCRSIYTRIPNSLDASSTGATAASIAIFSQQRRRHAIKSIYNHDRRAPCNRRARSHSILT